MCPRCGVRQSGEVAQRSLRSHVVMATAAMMCGFFALQVFLLLLGPYGVGVLGVLQIALGPLAVVLSIIALVGMSHSGNDAGRGMAITGLILGLMHIVACVVILLVFRALLDILPFNS
jgi:hypothetical protein